MMDDLIARLEAAATGSRDLDAAIHVFVTPSRITHPELPAGYTMTDLGHPQRNRGLAEAPYLTTNRGPAPTYTHSLDAALTLLPPWSWRVGILPSGRGSADLGTQASLQCIEGATPALALCIAALKARANMAAVWKVMD